MENDNRIPGLVNLKRLLQSVSKDRLEVLSTFPGLRVESFTGEARVHGHWMALALAARPDLRITFKVQFMSEAGARLAAMALKRKSEDVDFHMTSDFMKEFCNMTLGLLNKVLAENGYRSSISLPLITRGFDEVFFPESSGILLCRDYWRLHFDGHHITCSVHIELFENGIDLTGLPTAVCKEESVGDIEYL